MSQSVLFFLHNFKIFFLSLLFQQFDYIVPWHAVPFWEFCLMLCVCVCVCVFHFGLRGDELFLWPLCDSEGFFWLLLSCGCFSHWDPFLQMHAQMGTQSLKWTPLQISGLLLFAATFSEVLCSTSSNFLGVPEVWSLCLQLRKTAWLWVVALKLHPGSKLMSVEVPLHVFFLSGHSLILSLL